MESGLEDRNNPGSDSVLFTMGLRVSMESGLEDRNNRDQEGGGQLTVTVSQWSPA